MPRRRWARHQLRNVSETPSTSPEESAHIRAARGESPRIPQGVCPGNSGPCGTRSAGESKTIGRKPAWISLAGYAEAEDCAVIGNRAFSEKENVVPPARGQR